MILNIIFAAQEWNLPIEQDLFFWIVGCAIIGYCLNFGFRK